MDRLSLSTLLDAFPGPAFAKASSGNFLGCNDAFESAFGVTRTHVVGSTTLVIEALTEERRRTWHEQDLAFLAAGGGRTEMELAVPFADGRLHDILYHRRSFLQDGGSLGGFVGTLVDISERRRAERFDDFRAATLELLSRGDAPRDVLTALVTGAEWLMPGSMCSVLLLDPATGRLGRSIAPSLPDFYNEAFNGLAIGPGVASCGAAAATGERVLVDDIFRDPNWVPFVELASRAGVAACWSQPIVSSTGRVLGTFAIYSPTPRTPDDESLHILEQSARLATLILHQQTISDALALREAHLRTVIRTIPDLIFLKDVNGVYIGTNPVLERLYGASEAEILGKTDRDFVDKELADFFREKDRKAMESTERTVNQEWLTFKTGGHRGLYEMVKTAMRAPSGELLGVLGIGREITEHVELQESLRVAKEEAESATREKSMFLANMSHEIRTPMNAIIGLTELALRTTLTPRQQDYLDKVHASGKSLLGLLNDILDFSKMESGKLQVETISFDLDDVLGGISAVMAVQVEKKGLELLFARGSDVPRRLIGDPLRLQQILTNLTGNATKFTERGDIVVTTDMVQREGSRVRLRFSVADSGIGINPDRLGALFQPFAQEDSSTTRRFGGTGLGLAISRQLVELMNGRIWANSVPGQGSTFHFEVELGVSDTNDAFPPRAPLDIGKLRVLVVDDNANARKILRGCLEGSSLRVETSADAEDALARIREASSSDPYRLVIMDARMAGLDGISAAKQIKREVLPAPHVILLSAATRIPGEDLDAPEGVDEIIAKPVLASAVFDAIATVFGRAPMRTARSRSGGRTVTQPALEAAHGARILLVEDNELNRQVACELLEQAGMVVEVAVNGRNALERLERASFDCVLMDLQMPVMDGYEATSRIRASGKYPGLPILAMSANVLAEDRAKGAAIGMNGHIAKPINPRELFAALEQWLPRGYISTPSGAPTSERAVLRTRLPPTLPGMDISAALVFLDGNETLLRRLLLQFRADHAHDGRRIVDALRSKSLAEAERTAHTIKGLGGTLQAKRLAFAAEKVERLISARQIDAAAAAVPELSGALDEVLEGIATIDPPTTPAAASGDTAAVPDKPLPTGGGLSPTARDQLNRACDALAPLLQELSPDAVEFVAAIESVLVGTAHEAAARMLASQTEAFEFSAALDSLNSLRRAVS